MYDSVQRLMSSSVLQIIKPYSYTFKLKKVTSEFEYYTFLYSFVAIAALYLAGVSAPHAPQFPRQETLQFSSWNISLLCRLVLLIILILQTTLRMYLSN